jgi:hypothetical protein
VFAGIAAPFGTKASECKYKCCPIMIESNDCKSDEQQDSNDEGY